MAKIKFIFNVILLIQLVLVNNCFTKNTLENWKAQKDAEQLQNQIRIQELEKQKLQKMLQYENESLIENKVIQIKNAEQYHKLVYEQEGRPYDVVVLFNLLPKEQIERCNHCLLAEKAFLQTAYSFIHSRNQEKELIQKYVFFVIFYIDPADEYLIYMFQNIHGYDTVPWLSISPQWPASKGKFPKQIFSKQWNILSSDSINSLKFIEIINSELKTDVKLKLTLSQALKANLIITGLVSLQIFLIIFWYKALLNRYIWSIVCFIIWIVCTGGYVYVKVEKPEKYLSHIDEETKKVVIDQYFMRSFSNQYAYEGYIYSSLVVLISVCFLIVYHLSKYVSTHPVIMRVIVYSFLAFIVYIWKQIQYIGEIKGITQAGFQPPYWFMKGWIRDHEFS